MKPAARSHYFVDHERPLDGKYLAVFEAIPKGARVLEFGCHNGFLGHHLRGRAEYLGYDYDPTAVHDARSNAVNVHQGDINAIELPEAGYDCIVLMDILEHLPDPKATLVRLKPSLAANAKLLVTGPNVAFWRVRYDLLMGRFNYVEDGIMDPTHRRFFTKSGWTELFKAAGLRVERVVAVDGFFPAQRHLRKLPLAGKLLDRLVSRLSANASPWYTTVFFFDVRAN